jgi:plastocyanin
MLDSRYKWMILAGLLAVAVAVPLVGWQLHRKQAVIHARMAESGGWMPQNLVAEVGKPLHLRLTSDDVMHGFVVGKLDVQSVDIRPGEISEITLTFDHPGRYVFYCTRWCSLNHWRMRGLIEVVDPGGSTAPVEPPPLYALLGLDLDAEHPPAGGRLTKQLFLKFIARKIIIARIRRRNCGWFCEMSQGWQASPIRGCGIWSPGSGLPKLHRPSCSKGKNCMRTTVQPVTERWATAMAFTLTSPM